MINLIELKNFFWNFSLNTRKASQVFSQENELRPRKLKCIIALNLISLLSKREAIDILYKGDLSCCCFSCGPSCLDVSFLFGTFSEYLSHFMALLGICISSCLYWCSSSESCCPVEIFQSWSCHANWNWSYRGASLYRTPQFSCPLHTWQNEYGQDVKDDDSVWRNVSLD